MKQKNQEKLKATIEYLQYNGPLFIRSISKIDNEHSQGMISPTTSSVIT
jgi:hypothetical protein